MPKITKETDPIAGQYKEMAALVREILRWGTRDRVTLRDAARLTNVSHTTIGSMADGDRPAMNILIDFARGMGADPNRLLRSADYPEIIPAPEIIRSWLIQRLELLDAKIEQFANLLGFDSFDDLIQYLSSWQDGASNERWLLFTKIAALLDDREGLKSIEVVIPELRHHAHPVLKIGSNGEMDRSEIEQLLPRTDWPGIVDPIPSPGVLVGKHIVLQHLLEDYLRPKGHPHRLLSELAQLSNLNCRTIGAMVCGFRPTEDTLTKLCKSMHWDVSRLRSICFYLPPNASVDISEFKAVELRSLFDENNSSNPHVLDLRTQWLALIIEHKRTSKIIRSIELELSKMHLQDLVEDVPYLSDQQDEHGTLVAMQDGNSMAEELRLMTTLANMFKWRSIIRITARDVRRAIYAWHASADHVNFRH